MTLSTSIKRALIGIYIRFEAYLIKVYISFKKYLISNYIRFKGNKIYLNRAIREAKALHKKTGLRYRVFFFGYNYVVWTRSDIKDRKRCELFKKHLKAGEDFDKICFYDTNKIEGHVSK